MARPKDYTSKLLIWNADKMTAKELAGVADWLRRQAEAIEEDGGIYSALFTAKYMKVPRRARG